MRTLDRILTKFKNVFKQADLFVSFQVMNGSDGQIIDTHSVHLHVHLHVQVYLMQSLVA